MENNTLQTSLTDLFNITTTGTHQVLEFKKGINNVIVFDPGANHTSFCKSSISRIDGKTGQLFYGSTPIEEKIGETDFEGLAFQLITQLDNDPSGELQFSKGMHQYFVLDAGIQAVLQHLPASIHPMDFLLVGVTALSGIEEKYIPGNEDPLVQAQFIIAQLFVIAAYYYQLQHNITWNSSTSAQPVYHRFLQQVSPEKADLYAPLFNIILMLHAEHGQNCSTATVRNIASAGGDIYTAIASGIAAFKGRLHGGASQYVSQMYNEIIQRGISASEFIAEKMGRREVIYGFGHRIYKNWDPRARIMYNMLQSDDPVYVSVDVIRRLAFELTDRVSNDTYFTSRFIFPNPDLFNNVFYTLFGMPSSMNTVMLSLSRVAGWIAHYYENQSDRLPIIRPQELYK
ncbi:citrate/2-methylcitrate synthase [Chitinophaga filiformis]|uniref:citrate/2-methylcitrate synthase n=1 Tax=Chitinophaga filiformis TaxID=104663 RepID=UPI001F1A721F|nr:citrate/2-methylcitrate synthase [Chitinophaga filiformis]MCF6402492.1 citrate/2-methylcitrate synthase [Chitinophaga filiformis]